MPINQNLMKITKNKHQSWKSFSELYQVSEQHSFKNCFMYKTLQNMQPSHSWNQEDGKVNLLHMNVYWEYTFLFSPLNIYYLSYIYHLSLSIYLFIYLSIYYLFKINLAVIFSICKNSMGATVLPQCRLPVLFTWSFQPRHIEPWVITHSKPRDHRSSQIH